MKQFIAATALLLAGAACAPAEVKPNSLFSEGAVLQRDMALPVWGTAKDGERVTVQIAGQRVSTAAVNGKWMVRLTPLKAGGPYTLVVSGENTITLTNILIGDVWVCSGQSNMERQLGPRPPQKPIVQWEQEVAAANYPAIRQFFVPHVLSPSAKADVQGRWTVCSPATVKDFSAVGYFFARDVHKAAKVPIGLLFAAWGGTPAEAWVSPASLKMMPEFGPALGLLEQAAAGTLNPAASQPAAVESWYAIHDEGSVPGREWFGPALDDSAWAQAQVPGDIDPLFDGVVWFRKEFDAPPAWAGRTARLDLGQVDDEDTTWINGRQVGQTLDWRPDRHYTIPAGVLAAGRNVIAVRMVDMRGAGGLHPRPNLMQIVADGGDAPAPIKLFGTWKLRSTVSFVNGPIPVYKPEGDQNAPGVLYNGMIAGLQNYPIKGAIWYQGESNDKRARQYRTLFPLLISDWRKIWRVGDFPFLFVQIAPYGQMTPDIRESQLLTLRRVPNTAMAVITDAGDASDIHPAHKQPVGERLSLAARALAYGEKIEYSGPLLARMGIEGSKARLAFSHAANGLVASNGSPRGFTISGDGEHFFNAVAELRGNEIVVSSPQVSTPKAVRYGWARVPEVNVYNKEGLPASPFRTDTEGPAGIFEPASFELAGARVVGLKSTEFGSPNSPAGAGDFGGAAGADELPAAAIDGNTTTRYFNRSKQGDLPAGVNSGLAIALAVPTSVCGFQIATAADRPDRDPLEVTIEGSNDPKALEPGFRDFVRIYAGETGLDPDPGRGSWGRTITFTNTAPCQAYRILVTVLRDEARADGVQYSELRLMRNP